MFLSYILQEMGSPAFLCVLGSRLLFNIKEAAERGVNEGTSYKLKTLSNMDFAEGAGNEGEFDYSGCLLNIRIK